MASRAFFSFLHAKIIVAPCYANLIAVCLPIPVLHPVIMIISSFMSLVSLQHRFPLK